MRIIGLLLVATTIMLMGADATLQIVKAADSRPTIAIEVDESGLVSPLLQQRFFKLVVGDLKVGSHFKVDNRYRKHPYGGAVDLAGSTSRYLMRYRLQESSRSGYLDLAIKLYDMGSRSILFERRYRVANRARYPFLIHQAIVDLNRVLGMPSVTWMKRYVVFSEYVGPRRADIIISDYTLTYRKRLVRGGLNIFPKWADRMQRGFYYTKIEDRPTLYYYNIYTGHHKRIMRSSGMLVCSDVSKDGRKLLLTMAPKGQPDIYLYDRLSDRLKRLTFYRGIDVSAQFIDHESGVAFISNRLGHPNIFALSIGRRGVRQLVYHGRNNSACSAHNHLIVYSSRETNNLFSSNTFNLYLISTQSDSIRRLTASGINQFPRFSEDGDTILYLKHFFNESALGIIRLGDNESYLFPLRGQKIQSIDW